MAPRTETLQGPKSTLSETPSELSRTLHAASNGDETAAAELLPLMYTELRGLAAALMSKVPPGNTLQPTALVHEAYLRVVGEADPGWNGRGHFFASAAQAMRRILVDQARRKSRRKHGGDRARVPIDDADLAIEPPHEDMLALDDALRRLEHEAPEAARVVLLRYFAGLTAAETAGALNVSLSTVERRWRAARAVLHSLLVDGHPDSG